MSSANKNASTAEKPQSKAAGSLDEKDDKLQRQPRNGAPQAQPEYEEEEEEEDDDDDEEEEIPQPQLPARRGKRRMVPVHQSRIADRPVNNKASTMNIKIELDLEVEVEIYARVKGDVMIGLM